MQRILAILLIYVVITVACTAESDPVPVTRTQTAVPTNNLPSPTAFQTAVAQSTAPSSPTPTTSLIATPTLSQTPTRTPRPRPSPTPTATPITHYELPAWVDDPDVPVLLVEGVLGRDTDTAVSLFNVLTGERWDILPNPYHASHSWVERDGQLFIQLGYPTSTNPDAPGPLRLQISVPDGEISEAPLRPSGAFSNDGRSLISLLDADNPEQLALYTNYNSGEDLSDGIPLTDPFNGRYNSYRTINWSPDDSYIAILRVAFPEDRDGASQYGLAIYTADGELFGTYDGVVGWYWSATDPPRILYSINTIGNNQIPCVLDVISSESRCFYSLENWQQAQEVDIYQFVWSPDSTHISFVTYNNPSLCVIEIASENVHCLVIASDLIMGDVQFHIVRHSWSEDGKYLSIDMNPNGVLSDDATNNYLAVLTAEGSDFRILGQTLVNSQSDRIWRPIQ